MALAEARKGMMAAMENCILNEFCLFGGRKCLFVVVAVELSGDGNVDDRWDWQVYIVGSGNKEATC